MKENYQKIFWRQSLDATGVDVAIINDKRINFQMPAEAALAQRAMGHLYGIIREGKKSKLSKSASAYLSKNCIIIDILINQKDARGRQMGIIGYLDFSDRNGSSGDILKALSVFLEDASNFISEVLETSPRDSRDFDAITEHTKDWLKKNTPGRWQKWLGAFVAQLLLPFVLFWLARRYGLLKPQLKTEWVGLLLGTSNIIQWMLMELGPTHLKAR